MKEILYQPIAETPLDYPFEIQTFSADGIPMTVTIEDAGEVYELWLYIPSTYEKAKIAEFTKAMGGRLIIAEIERKYESVFAHVVHHRLTIPYTPGKGIYHNIPPFP